MHRAERRSQSWNLLDSMGHSWLDEHYPALAGVRRYDVWRKMSVSRRLAIVDKWIFRAEDKLSRTKELRNGLQMDWAHKHQRPERKQLKSEDDAVDLNLCSVGDKLLLRNGEAAVYAGLTAVEEPDWDKLVKESYPHLVWRKGDMYGYPYCTNGRFFYSTDVRVYPLDVVKVLKGKSC